LICANGVVAQDLHFSNPLLFQSYFNPALTGGDADQWTSFGYGGQLYQNNAGESSLKTIGGKSSFSYAQRLSGGNSFLQAGASIGFLQKSFNTSLMTFDQQFVEDIGFDSGLQNGEHFSETSKIVIDGSVGLVWKSTFGNSRKIDATLGVAIHNFHQPKDGFLTDAVLSMKQVLQGQLDISINPKTTLQPLVFYQKQGVQKETLAGLNLVRMINENCDVEIGIAKRLEDAWIITGGIKWGNTKVIVSYDYNTSTLKSATNGKGAIELGLKINFDLATKGLHLNEEPIFSKSVAAPTLKRQITKPEKALYTDSDNDGVRDIDDDCPNLKGDTKNNGCPAGFKDTDRDGVPDDKDYCIHIKGSAEFNGCPDSDEDGVSDIDDKCPYLKGMRNLNGCPE